MRLAGPAQRRQQPGTSPDQAVASRPAPGRESTRPGAGRHLRRRLEIALFVSPALLLYLVFVLLPIVLAAYYSVFHWNGLDPLNDFVGLDNYRRAHARAGGAAGGDLRALRALRAITAVI